MPDTASPIRALLPDFLDPPSIPTRINEIQDWFAELNFRCPLGVIVTDISMPKLGGISTVDRPRDLVAGTRWQRVVFLVAHGDADSLDAALRTGRAKI
jgi:CheY-like chemotaxis protein